MTPEKCFPPAPAMTAFPAAAHATSIGSPSAPRISEPASDVLTPETSCPVVPRWKRALDIGIILLASPLVFPLMVLIALLIKIVSPGPIFFRQRRIGHGGREFNLLKFRTMRPDADSSSHHSHLQHLMRSEAPMTKLDAHDPRVIPGGRLLRATGLDELPQLVNVFRGQMSLVGPRPCTPYEFDHYSAEQKRRFGSLPGLTGLWQVSGKNRTTFQEMIRLDVRYVETANLMLDLEILARTPFAVLTQVSETILGPTRTPPVSSPPQPNRAPEARVVEG